MNQADVTKLLSRLRVSIQAKPRGFRQPDGPEGKFLRYRKTVTALIKYERIELNYYRADECRGYVERLISDAIRYGDCHRHTMEMASHWILEKQYVHKLFKVLVPRFQDMNVSYTRLYKAPFEYPGHGRPRAVLELRGHPFPAIIADKSRNRLLIHNVLLDAARKEFREQKYAAIVNELAPPHKKIDAESNSKAEKATEVKSEPVAEKDEAGDSKQS